MLGVEVGAFPALEFSEFLDGDLNSIASIKTTAITIIIIKKISILDFGPSFK
jgi:hypothetical protein